MACVDHAFSISDEDIMMETSYNMNNSPPVKEIALAISVFVFGLIRIILGSFMTYNRIGGDRGTYDKMEALLSQNILPVDILLMLAASEGDKPKIEKLLTAGATYNVKDADGRTALYRGSEEIKDFILGFSVQKS